MLKEQDLKDFTGMFPARKAIEKGAVRLLDYLQDGFPGTDCPPVPSKTALHRSASFCATICHLFVFLARFVSRLFAVLTQAAKSPSLLNGFFAIFAPRRLREISFS
ncbi:hypothetical protein [Tichowtungia aerotolerans]|uniref:Uncharacterized protein n=1 Tax=Tichowtungia aerotolerans TaxID=2697043 RepID=A0A6P1M3H3_9BACT|nr:hypothetical protein [Tichowtungia aerotolerans]QHI68371.1 hypothetical protein GT409_02500 [Tichowtungia aerotolerans]